VTAADRASLQAVVGFDAAVWELWPYLAAGASVHIPQGSVRSNPDAIREWLLTQKISITFFADNIGGTGASSGVGRRTRRSDPAHWRRYFAPTAFSRAAFYSGQ